MKFILSPFCLVVLFGLSSFADPNMDSGKTDGAPSAEMVAKVFDTGSCTACESRHLLTNRLHDQFGVLVLPPPPGNTGSR